MSNYIDLPVEGGGGGGSGTVTSVGLTAPSIFSVSGSPVTTSGSIALTLVNETANRVFAGPASGGAAAPTFRALVTADLPAGTGTVTSVGLALPAALFSVSGSPVTASGTLTGSLSSQTANTVFAAPNGAPGSPTFRALVLTDLPTGAKPAGASTNIQYNNSGSFGGASQAIIDTNGYMNTTSLANNAAYPSAPAAGLSLLAKDIAGVSWLTGIDRNSNQIAYGSSQFGGRQWFVSTEAGAVSFVNVGFPLPTASGTLNNRTVTVGSGLFLSMVRTGATSAAAINSQSGIHPPVSSLAASIVPQYGARYMTIAGNTIIASTSNWFAGLFASVTVPTATVDPSSLFNVAIIGADVADTNLQVMFNDGSGAATKIDLGANFPAKTSATDVYAFYVTIATGGTTYYWQVIRLNTGDIASGTQTTNLPVLTAALQTFQIANTMAGTTAVETSIFRTYAETPY